KKAKRKRITPEQLKELTAVFEKTDTPTHDIREELSSKLAMTNREVQVWFQNRRAKYNRLR
ncbi:homeobox domain-containing protein, partial [Kickxella alabastrina]|uniref:homeobox domain-containing protein n=1 Tax=Kickxella alabastrina TaxID=61397 RepID=UPI00221FDBED